MNNKREMKKASLIAGLKEIRGRILESAASLSPHQQDEMFLGVWSIKDLLAHLTGWDFANMEAAQAILEGRLPAFYAYHNKDWQSYNAYLVGRYKRENFAELLENVAGTHHRLIDFLETIPAEAFTKDTGVRFRGYKVTIERLLQAEIQDEQVHRNQIEAFKQQSVGQLV